MIAFPRTRAVATVLLATALLLPAYTCEGYRSAQGELVENIPSGADSAAYTPTKIPHRPLESFDPTVAGDWLTLLAYLWPILVLGLRLRPSPGRLDRVMHWSEFLFAPASAVVVYYVAAIGDVAYGTYLAYAANATLFSAGILEFVKRRRAAGAG